MTAEDIPALIARIRAVQSDGYLSATYLGNEHVGDLLGEILDAMKVEHERAERYRELARRTELQCQDAEAEATKWQKLWEKAANGVLSLQAERDALRAAIQNARLVIKNKADTPALTIAIVTGILSRAINTKEQS